jgi:hypothetical protein
MQHGGFFPQTAQLLRLCEQLVIDDQSRSHMHQYGLFMQIRQGNEEVAQAAIGPQRRSIASGSVPPSTYSM